MTRSSSSGPETPDLSRRAFLKGGGAAAAGGLFAKESAAALQEAAAKPARVLEGTQEVTLRVNKERVRLQVEPRTTLLSALRDRLGLTGTKLVCDHGSCGACTVQVEGRPVYSCMQLALRCEGLDIRTVEGLSNGSELSPLQGAFCDKDASMCGFCTPGFLMSLTSAIEEKGADVTDEELRSACSGNLCRCGTYPFLFAAARQAANEAGGK